MALLDNLPETIYNGVNSLGGTAWDMTLSKRGAATKDAYGATSRAADTDYSGRGFVEDYSDAARAQGGIPISDRKAILLAFSFSVDPAAGDTLTAESVDYTIVSVARDPAEATWVCQVRA